MILTLIDITSLIQANTNQYDTEDTVSDFHYTENQHNRLLNHPKRGTDHYLFKGIHALRSMAYISY